ncbi:hypothetical protein SDRG_16229, partial [Saprolegnia diclina VS20]
MRAPSSTSCRFNGCTQRALPVLGKCEFHRHRLVCHIDGCNNIVYARQLCVRHGGKLQCAQDDCSANARIDGYCSRHALPTAKRACSEPHCRNLAHSRSKCVRHGGARRCGEELCVSLARTGGFCRRHNPSKVSLRASPVQVDMAASDDLQELDNKILQCLLIDSPRIEPMTPPLSALEMEVYDL